MRYVSKYLSPLGPMMMASNGIELTGLWFNNQKYFPNVSSTDWTVQSLPLFDRVKEWLDIYFKGDIPDFLPPLYLEGTPFQTAIWHILLTIPYGEVVTYGDIAQKFARQNNLKRMSAQAVGGAVSHNPISIIVPCHRVVGQNGNLTGYAGGLPRKIELLKIEQKNK